MLAQNWKSTNLNLQYGLKLLGIVGGSIGILGILLPAIAYWPQVLFNAPMLINSPLRYLFLVLLVVRLLQLGAGRGFAWAALIAGVISTCGTIIMSAVPYTTDAAVHEIGIPIFFLGVVIVQMLLGVTEWRLKSVPRLLPVLCFVVVAAYVLFFILVMLYEGSIIGRTVPIFPEWLCAVSLLIWVFAHGLVMGRESTTKG
jgi:hypothetical protein